MNKTPEEYLKEPYTRVFIPEAEGGYSAEILEFPGCYSDGDTLEEANANLEEAAKGWIEAAQSLGQSIPAPSSNQGYSGKFALRLPRSTHREAARMAERDGCSVNQFFVNAIAEKVGARNAHNQVFQKLEQMVNQLETRLISQKAENRVERAIDVANIIWGDSALNARQMRADTSPTIPSGSGFSLFRTTGSKEAS